MSYEREIDAIRNALRGDHKPFTRMGVTLGLIPWWRRRIQRYLAPRRFKLWAHREILSRLENAE